jgi:hypothetical protein
MRRTLAVLSTAALLPLALASQSDARTPAHVTWHGWRAATLGADIHQAARTLHKPLFKGCAPLLRMEHTAKGLYISNAIHSGDAIDDISVGEATSASGVETASSVRGPLGIHVGERIAALRSELSAHDLTLHARRNAETGERDDYWVKGAAGHVLWFRLDRVVDDAHGEPHTFPRQISTFSLNSSKADAFTAMGIEGGC